MTDEEWSNLPEVGNLTRKKRKKDERSFVVPDSILVGDRSKNEYENALDPMQQEVRVIPMHASEQQIDIGFVRLVDSKLRRKTALLRTSSK